MKRLSVLLFGIFPNLVFGINCNLIDSSSDPVALKCKIGNKTQTTFMQKKNLLKMYWDTKALNLPIKINNHSPLYRTPKLLNMINGCLYTSEMKTILPKGAKRKICATAVKCKVNGNESVKVATCLQRKRSCPEPFECLTDNTVSVSDATFLEKSSTKPIRKSKGSEN